jgi:uncharacterized protein YdeI (YjbR/CyaY-like superfamily)
MNEMKAFHADTLEQWRAWLEENYASSPGVWLVLCKKASAKPSVGDADAAEEALCFGWVDSLIRKLDEDSYMMKFTPRKDTAKWSAYNISRVKRLIAEGRMRPAGREKIPDEYLEEGYVPEQRKEPNEAELLALLGEYPAALEKFKTFPASSRRNYCLWVLSAKREETRRKRVEEAAGMIGKGIKSVMK